MITKRKHAPEKVPGDLLLPLIDPEIPFEHRLQFLASLCLEDDESSKAVVRRLLEAAAENAGASLVDAKLKELHAAIEELKNSPLRGGTFLRLLSGDALAKRAEVVLNDGQLVYAVVIDPSLAGSLQCGDAVLLDGQGK